MSGYNPFDKSGVGTTYGPYTQAQEAEHARANWVLWGALALGGFILWRVIRRKAS